VKALRILLAVTCLSVCITTQGYSNVSDSEVAPASSGIEEPIYPRLSHAINCLAASAFLDQYWPENVTETKSLVENNQHVYLIAETGIVRYDKQVDKQQVLIPGRDINSFRLSDGHIYYCEDKTTIYRTDINGKNKEKVLGINQVFDLLAEKRIDRFEVFGSYLFLQPGYLAFVRISLLTGEIESFLTDFNEYAFLDASCYYLDHGEKTFSIIRRDIDNKTTEILRGDGISKRHAEPGSLVGAELFDNVITVDGQLYYTMRAPANVYMFVDNGNDVLIAGSEQLADAQFLKISASGSNLYYLVESGLLAGNLFSYNTQSGEYQSLTVLDDINNVFGFKVINGLVFYYKSGVNPFQGPVSYCVLSG
jgi:hypothetical protein